MPLIPSHYRLSNEPVEKWTLASLASIFLGTLGDASKAACTCFRILWDSSGLAARETKDSISKVKQPASGHKTNSIMNTQNYIHLSGRLTADAQPNQAMTFSRFSIAQNQGEGNDTLFMNCVIFKKEFEKNNQTIPWDMLKKGNEVFVCGRIRPNNWTDSDGAAHKGFEIVLNKIRDNAD